MLQDDVETDDEMSTDAHAETEGNDIPTSAVPSQSTYTSASDSVVLVSHRKQAANDNPVAIEGSRQKRDATSNLKAVLTKATQALNTISETACD